MCIGGGCGGGGWREVWLYLYPNLLFLGSHKFDLYRFQFSLASINLTTFTILTEALETFLLLYFFGVLFVCRQ